MCTDKEQQGAVVVVVMVAAVSVVVVVVVVVVIVCLFVCLWGFVVARQQAFVWVKSIGFSSGHSAVRRQRDPTQQRV